MEASPRSAPTYPSLNNLSLKSRIALLVLLAVVPSALAGLGVTYMLYEANRANASASVQQIARTLLQTTEALIQDLTTTAEILALSSDAARGDFEAFRPWANLVINEKVKGSTVVITDRDGVQRFNTAAAPSEALPAAISTPTIKLAATKTFDERQRSVTDLFYAPVLKEHRLVVHVPVFRDGEAVFMLGLSFRPRVVEDALLKAELPAQWTVAVFDSSNHSFARLPRSPEIGRPASPTLRPALEQRRDQVLDTVTLEGTSVLTGVAYSPKLGWSVAVGVPHAILFQPVRDAIFWIGVIGTLSLALGLLASTRLARRVISGERQRDFLINELNHRVKNSLSMIQSVARQTLRHSQSLTSAEQSLEARIIALSKAHDLLTSRDWRSASLPDVIEQVLGPFNQPARIKAAGPSISLNASLAVAFALVLNELATNASKYGSLSSPNGRVDISWQFNPREREIHLVWLESGGPAVAEPQRSGFGTRMITSAFAPSLTATVKFLPGGLVCEILGTVAQSPSPVDAEEQTIRSALPNG